MKRFLFIIPILILSGCRYFNVSPVDGITYKNLSEKPDIDQIAGVWEVDKFSYDLARVNGYDNIKIELKINKDNTFEAQNFPDFITVFKEEKEHKLYNLKGKWKIEKDYKGELWILNLRFEDSELYKGRISISYDLYLKDDKLIIWSFIGDPDSGERFLFEKKN